MRLSAVIPTIGRENYLDLAVESLLSQSVPFDEIVIFDNSKEQKLEELSKFKNNPNIKFINSGLQLDPINSWNNAVKSTTSEYVVIIGDDDIALPNFSVATRKTLEKSDVVIAQANSIDEKGTKLFHLPYPKNPTLTYEEFFKERLSGRCSLFVPGIAFKKELFTKVNGFINTGIEGLAYSDELLLFSMAYVNKGISLTNEICWNYRIHSGQLGGVKKINKIIETSNDYLILYENQLKELGFNNSDDLYFGFGKSKFLARVVGYRLMLYASYSASHVIFTSFLKQLSIELYDSTKMNYFESVKLHIVAIKTYFKNTSAGQRAKKALKKCQK